MRCNQYEQGTRRRLLERLEEAVGGILVHLIRVIDDGDLVAATVRFEPEIMNRAADRVDRQFMFVVRTAEADQVRMAVGLDVNAARAFAARVKIRVAPSLA